MGLYRHLRILAVLLLLCGAGCRSVATMHAWVPPALQSATDRRVVLADIVGPKPLVDDLQTAMLRNVPSATAGELVLATQDHLQQAATIQLVSATEDLPSDVAVLSAARRQNYDYALFGEVLVYPSDRGKRIAVSWRLIDVENESPMGAPISVRQEEQDEQSNVAVMDRIAKASWELLLPHTQPFKVELAHPRLALGSTKVREGNILATHGLWAEAEKVWQQVFDSHPSNHAALHNLALAAAAAQDFPRAKQLAQQALQMHSSELYETTVVWIEQRQIDLSRAFRLSAPSEGWLFAPDDVHRN